MRYLLACLGLVSFIFAACGSDDPGTPAAGSGGGNGVGGSGQAGTGGGGNPSNGVTPCGNFPDQVAKSCIAGQYCEDEIFSKCANGCLSDTNCTSEQTCAKSATNVGSCQAKVAGKDCPAFVTKCKACEPTATDAKCQQLCDGVSTECVNCVKDANCTDTKCNALCGM
jgi:hypothetical protein